MRIGMRGGLIGVGFIWLGIVAEAQDSRAVPAQIRTQAPGYYRLPLGDFVVTAVSDGTVPQPMDQVMSNTTPEEVKALVARSHASLPLETSINTFLIHTGQKLILVDAGAGRLFGPDSGGRLVANLRAAGYSPAQVDAVLLTHIHGDHSFGLTVAGARVFPTAEILVNRVERDFWLSATERERAPEARKRFFDDAHRALDPYIQSGQLRPFDGAVELFPGIRARPMPGHTPGHTFFEVESRGQKLVIIGDTVHAAEVQFPRPSITIQYDSDPTAAAAQRLRFFEEAAARGFWVGAEHISFPGLGHIRPDGSGFAWIPAPYQAGP